MKKCSRCEKEKDDLDFYKKGKENRTSSYCKSCFNKYCVERWIETKKKAIKYKGEKCVCCGYSKYYGSLDFHHLDPKEKDVNWDKLRLRSWEKIKNELDKCVIFCNRCHQEIHGGVTDLPKNKC